MNKEQMRQELEGIFYKVGEERNLETNPVGLAVRQKEGISWHEIGVYEADGNVMTRRSLQLYIVDEGTEKEQVFYKDQLPVNNLVKAREAAEKALEPEPVVMVEPPKEEMPLVVEEKKGFIQRIILAIKLIFDRK